MEGWIKVHRSLTQWQWYTNPVVKVVFLHLLLICNHKPNTWNRNFDWKRSSFNLLSKYSKRYGAKLTAS